MNPLSNLLEVPLWQFQIIYGATLFFATLFALHLRWEARAPDAAPAELSAEERAELARGRTAERSAETKARLRERGLVVVSGAAAQARGAIAAMTLALAALGGTRLMRAQAQGQAIGGLAAAIVVTLAGGAALAAAPFWLTERATEALTEKQA